MKTTQTFLLAFAAAWFAASGAQAKYFDGETGLYYYGHRYYSPSTGRWLSKDPIGEQGGLNLYGFVHNAPVGTFDPFGELGENLPPGAGSPDRSTDPYSPYQPIRFPDPDPVLMMTLYKIGALAQTVGGTAEVLSGAVVATGGAISEGGSMGVSSPVSLPVALGGTWLFVNGLDNASTGVVNLFSNARLRTWTENAVGSYLNDVGFSSGTANTLSSSFNSMFMMAGGGGPLMCGPVKVTVVVERTTTLYRVVGPGELAAIKELQQYLPSPGGAEVKYFYPSAQQASDFAANVANAPFGPFTLTSTEVPTSLIDLGTTVDVATEGKVIVMPNAQLPALGTPKIYTSLPIPSGQ